MAEGDPLLIVYTELVKKPQMVWSIPSIDRTIRIRSVIAGIGGGLIGLIFSLPFWFLHLSLIAFWVIGLFVCISIVSSQVSFRDESFLRGLAVFVRSRQQRVTVDGRRVKLYLDCSPITTIEHGTYRLVPTAAPIGADLVDRRGGISVPSVGE